VIPPAVVERYREKIERMADDIKVIMQQEKEERLVCDVMPPGGEGRAHVHGAAVFVLGIRRRSEAPMPS
jgi:hypothetical protein